MDVLTFVTVMGGVFVVLPVVVIVFAAMLSKLFYVILTRW